MSRRHLLLSASVAALAILAPITRPQDAGSWSRFRGPNGLGIGDGAPLPTEIGKDRNVVWRTALPSGRSSPVLWGDRVFVTAVDGQDLLTICLDRATGEPVWRMRAPRDRQSKLDARNDQASPSPAVDADTVVVFFQDYGVVAYDHAGEERWRVPLGPFDNVYGMGASPVLFEDRVFLACDQQNGSFVVALRKTDGGQIWRAARPRAISGHCTPILYRPSDGAVQLLLPGSFVLDAYDTQSGERVWWVNGLACEMKSVPVLLDGTIYINGYASPLNQPGSQIELPPWDEIVASNDADGDGAIAASEMPENRARMFADFVDLDGDGKLDADNWALLRAALASQNGMLAITAGGRGDMTESALRWSYHRSVPQLPSPLVYSGVLYMVNDQGGIVVTLDPETGDVLARGRLADAVDNYYASPVAGDGKVYLVSETGIVSVLPAGGSLEPVWTSELDEECYATPAIVDGRIYLRTQKALYCFGER